MSFEKINYAVLMYDSLGAQNDKTKIFEIMFKNQLIKGGDHLNGNINIISMPCL